MVLPIIAAGARAAATATVRAGSSAVKAGAKTSTRNAGVVTKNTLGKAANDNPLRAANDNARTQNAGVEMRQTKTITGDFLKRKSINALTRKKTDDTEDEHGGGRVLDRVAKNIAMPQRALAKSMTGIDTEDALNMAKKGVSLAKKRFGISTMFWIAGFCYFWQFIFGTIAIALILLGNYEVFGFTGDQIAEFLTGTAGAVVEGIINVVGFLFGFHIDLVPVTFSTAGLVFWGITHVFTLIGYVGIIGTAYLTGTSLTDSPGIFITMALCIAGSMCIITQLFPWMLLLVLVIMLRKVSPAHH